MDVIGPLQLLVVGFTDPKLDGSILGELEAASESGAIKVVDVLGVYKDESGDVLAAEATDLTEDEAMVYGAWVGALVGLGAGAVPKAPKSALWRGLSPLWKSTSMAWTPSRFFASLMTSHPAAQHCWRS